jgi:uncharacterized protein (TIGR03435 family)
MELSSSLHVSALWRVSVSMRTATMLVMSVIAAWAQSFEAATIRVAAPAAGYERATAGGARLNYSNMTLFSALVRSLGLVPQQLVGPSWVSSNRYDIAAKAPDGTPDGRLPLMLQHLLIERFNLVLHHETRDLAAYVLTIGKGRLKLEEVKDPAVKDNWGMNGNGPIAKSVSMAALAKRLGPMVQAPVLDRTGLNGYYSFPFGWTVEDTRRDLSPSVFTVVGELGLKLESRKTPFDIVVIDSGNQVPTED